jgi:hypothetical protein
MNRFGVLESCLMLLMLLIAAPAFSQSCPPHAHVTGTTQESNVRTIHCGCDTKYVNVDGRCTGRTACVSDAGYQLQFALADCENGKLSPASLSCFRDLGVSEKALSCITTLLRAGKSKISIFASCGLLATVPLDAAERCKDINNKCIEDALRAHKTRVAVCQK